MNPIRKIKPLAGFINTIPGIYPSGQFNASAVQNCSIQFCGKEGLSLRHYWMKKHWQPVWLMSIQIRFVLRWPKLGNFPVASDHTSIQQHINSSFTSEHKDPNNLDQQPSTLLAFTGNPRKHQPKGLPFKYTDYLKLVDWTGYILRHDKRGAIPSDTPEILTRLNIETKHWLYLSKDFESPFTSLVGCAHQVRNACEELGKKWSQGMNKCAELFPET